MATAQQSAEWVRFLGVRDNDEASSEIRRLIARLDDAFDAVNYVLKVVNGAPGGEIDDVLHVGRRTIHESVELLLETRRHLAHGDPEAA